MLKNRKNEKGFTLVELILVIVVLGILAAVAVPKFLDLQSAAQDARRKGALAGFRGAITLLHAQYLLDTTSTYDATSVLAQTDLAGTKTSAPPAATATAITITWDDDTVNTYTYAAQSGFNPGTVN
ncbi:type II secretion system protein [Nitrospina watsonii]|uniref:Prepilin-type N-terminal cleavage/methylation domain-containing protein n=1 Tax=Nitrospina watsonii TaxID=1323948 RepID=A0ABM9H9T8_9BACT|nr:type II secretion system protein [Nitrospina watsonii]CAI2716899.1 conserved protein of unknown function [Nitrospina watsonii]